MEEETPIKSAPNVLRCIECGKVINSKEKERRKCQICGSPICLNHTYFVKVRREGLYGQYYDTIKVCYKCRI